MNILLQGMPDEQKCTERLLQAHALKPYQSQVSRVIRELSESGGPDLEYQIDSLIEDIRVVFHRAKGADRQTPELTFSESPSEFSELIEDTSPDIRREIERAYGLIWCHEALEEIIAQGDGESLINKYYLNYNVEQLEEVARTYLSVNSWRSTTLEWALVNALLYAEARAYTETLVTLPARLVGFATPTGVSRWGLGILSIGKFALEVLKLGLTAALALVLGDSNQVVIAMIFISITAARWLIPSAKDKQHKDGWRLAEKMLRVHRYAKSPSFNSRLVREMAYDASANGAVFSDYIFHILDKQMRTKP